MISKCGGKCNPTFQHEPCAEGLLTFTQIKVIDAGVIIQNVRWILTHFYSLKSTKGKEQLNLIV